MIETLYRVRVLSPRPTGTLPSEVWDWNDATALTRRPYGSRPEALQAVQIVNLLGFTCELLTGEIKWH